MKAPAYPIRWGEEGKHIITSHVRWKLRLHRGSRQPLRTALNRHKSLDTNWCWRLS